jgi:hypothetical protein
MTSSDEPLLPPIAVDAYEEVHSSGELTTPGTLIDGGDALRDRIRDDLLSGRYDTVLPTGPVIVLGKRDGCGDWARFVRFIPLCFGYRFEDHDHPYVRTLVSVLCRHGLLPLLRRGDQPVGSGFSVTSVPGRAEAAQLILLGGSDREWHELARLLRQAGHVVEGEHDGTGVLDVYRTA